MSKSVEIQSQDLTKRYTLGEEIFNSVSHGAGGLLSIAGTAVLIVLAAIYSNAWGVVSSAIFGASLISQVGYGQQKMDQLFNAFRGESDVTSVNIGNITMKLASLFTETMGVNGIEILEFDNCAQEVKDRLSTAIRNLRDSDYETMVTANERDSRTKVLVKIKEDMIRELVIFTTGSDNALIRIKGKISPSDLDRVINEHKTGNH